MLNLYSKLNIYVQNVIFIGDEENDIDNGKLEGKQQTVRNM